MKTANMTNEELLKELKESLKSYHDMTIMLPCSLEKAKSRFPELRFDRPYQMLNRYVNAWNETQRRVQTKKLKLKSSSLLNWMIINNQKPLIK